MKIWLPRSASASLSCVLFVFTWENIAVVKLITLTTANMCLKLNSRRLHQETVS